MFYMDEHVPSPITQGLRLRGVDVLTVQEDGRTGLPDALVLERATELGRLLFTIDADYYAIVVACQRAGTTMAAVIKGKPSLSYRQCIDDLELIANCIEPRE
jgi:predicted nuclease of predicted toxin-antitoxin system